MSDSVRPHRRQPTRLPCPWDSPGKNTGVGCHFLLQCNKLTDAKDFQTTRGQEEWRQDSEGTWHSWHLDFGLLAFRTLGQSLSVVVGHRDYGPSLGSPKKLTQAVGGSLLSLNPLHHPALPRCPKFLWSHLRNFYYSQLQWWQWFSC